MAGNQLSGPAWFLAVIVGIAVAFTTSAPLWVIATLALAYGMTSYSDTGTINTGTVVAAEQDVRGATMAVHASVGFAGGVLGSLAIGATLQATGGKDSADAWDSSLSGHGYGISLWLYYPLVVRTQTKGLTRNTLGVLKPIYTSVVNSYNF